MKTAEKILEKLTGESIDTLSKNYVSMDVILQAMEEYAQQIELPSDKEIEQECINRYIGNLAPTYFTEGAKWAVKWIKDKMK